MASITGISCTLSTLLAAIKHNATEIILSASLRCACNPVQLLQQKVSISLLLSYSHQQSSGEVLESSNILYLSENMLFL